jgi:hypothetical protein
MRLRPNSDTSMASCARPAIALDHERSRGALGHDGGVRSDAGVIERAAMLSGMTIDPDQKTMAAITQWTTAGAGILHIETPPEHLVVSGGLARFQLRVDLLKMHKLAVHATGTSVPSKSLDRSD